MVFIAWALVGTVLATGAAVFLAVVTTVLTRRVPVGRRRAILAAAILPFIWLGWGACVFIFQAVVNEVLLSRDLGIGDTWHAPLTNGYQIMMIDVTDQGWVYNPKTQPDGVAEQDDAVAGVRKVQVAGRYILGGVDSKAFDRSGKDDASVDSFFILDTSTGQQTTFKTYDGLCGRAQALQIKVNLEPISTVYGRFRRTWFDVFASVIFFMPPVGGFVLLAWWVWYLRRTRVDLRLAEPLRGACPS